LRCQCCFSRPNIAGYGNMFDQVLVLSTIGRHGQAFIRRGKLKTFLDWKA